MTKSECRRTTKAEFAERLKKTQNELDDAKKEAVSQRNRADRLQTLADERFDAISEQGEAIAEFKHQRNCCGVLAALFAAVAALALYSLAQQ